MISSSSGVFAISVALLADRGAAEAQRDTVLAGGEPTGVSKMNPIIPRIDICIATYKRPHLLRKLLTSLIRQETEGKFSYRIIISDNDNNRSAEAITNEFADAAARIIYDVEPRQNISLNRNRALSNASCDYIAILDDDQYVRSRWLLSLYDTLVSFHADVAFGAVIPVFDQNTSRLICKSNAFGVPNFPEGCTGRIVYHTGNCCFRAALIASLPAPFDSALGDRPGEDTKFFEALRRSGCKMVWSRQAVCYEYIPLERARFSWILKRCFQHGFMLFPTCGERRGCEILRVFSPLKRLDLLVKIVMVTFLFPLCVGFSLINAKGIAYAVTCLRHLAMYLGCSYYLFSRQPRA